MNGNELDECLVVAEAAARRAAEILADWRPKFSVREKGRSDLVTDADLASEQVIRAFLAEHYPSYGFLAEESAAGHLTPGDPPTWIVDPIDGTTNYVHDLPMYCISIGLWAAGELVAGVIYDPRHDEMFRAAIDRGAWLGERRLRVSETTELGNALCAVGFPADLTGKAEQLTWWTRFTYLCRGLRRTGSTALNLAYVAAGRFDGFWAMDNHIWDIAAGVVLVREAGGRVTHLHDAGYDPFGRELLAANPILHASMQDIFRIKSE